MSNRSHRSPLPPSLHRLLLAWLLPGVALLLLASGIGAYFAASNNATRAFDRSLLNLAIALANQAQVRAGEVRFDLQPQARQVLLTDKFDQIHYAVFGPQGQLLSGEEGIFPRQSYSIDDFEDGHLFFDDVVKGKPVRGVVLLAPVEGREITVVVTETLVKREMQVGDILLSILIPEVLLFAATIILVLHGVNAGLRPLDALRVQLSKRSPTDLRQVGSDQVPVELRPLVEEIDRLLDRLGTALDAQRHFVSDAAHQLRTPIAATLAQLESTRLESGDARLDPVLASTRRLVRLVNQLLALARAEPGGMALQPVSLNAMVEVEADSWLSAALARDIDLGFELAPAKVSGIPLLLSELAGNLVDNAIRYTPAGGRVTVRTGTDGDGAWLVVDDNGPGVPVAQRARIFERFFRGDNERGTPGGCGLGLAIVRQIALQHRATVTLGESIEGGASLVVRFPPTETPPSLS